MQFFISELRRRNVLRVAAFYAAGGWLLVQIATQVLPFFDIPNGVVRIVVIAIALGFPAALLFAWFYELTPQGLKLESEIAADASITRQTGRKLDRWISVVLGLAVVLLLADKLVLNKTAHLANFNGGDDKSIAVLPFANLSRDPDNAFFADGMQDEILTKISKIGALRAVSRTSTQAYGSAPGNIPEIARQLGVANILEGSVQKAGAAVHINVQLIRAATDEHLWAESYNRKLDDIFGVEGEVAQAVADALNAKLSTAEKAAVAAKPTTNTAAYEAYLRGRARVAASYSFASASSAVGDFLEAVRLDPAFALAWAQAAISMSIFYFDGLDQPRSNAAAVREAAETARRLQPDLAEALLAHGYYLYRVEHDYPGALEDFRLALEKQPNDALILHSMFLVERRLGHWDQALAHVRTAIDRDPRNVSIIAPAGCEGFNYVRRFDEARALLNRALQITPDEPNTFACLAQIEQNLGHLDTAESLLTKAQVDVHEVNGLTRISQLMYRRRYGELVQLLQASLPSDDARLVGRDLQNLVYLGYAQKWSGDGDAAKRSFERLIHVLQQSPDAMEHTEIVGYQTLGLAYAGLGDAVAAQKAATQGVEKNRNDAIKGPVAQIALAQVYTQTGNRDTAIALLPQLLQIPAGLNPALLRLDPIWDSIRDDPRFAKMALDASTSTSNAKK
ncbi:MAG: hypothetical protein JWR16_1416 [Nevskia sp.]|nr:hypothetical protein [Nevskia sp.]